MVQKKANDFAGLDAKQVQIFLNSHVEAKDVYKEIGLIIPISQDRSLLILEKLKRTSILKRILKKKTKLYRNQKTGAVIRRIEALRQNEHLAEITLNDSPLATVFYNRKQVTKLVNLYISFELNAKTRRSLASMKSREQKLLQENWELVEEESNGIGLGSFDKKIMQKNQSADDDDLPNDITG